MRTSSTQFQLLVEFMERNGDLSKPTEGPHGRATKIQLWSELTQLLNADATGDTKTVEKWRKNNIKKKAARIHRSTTRTGGGPASNLKLTDIEQRVLGLIGIEAATGLEDIPEVGLQEEVRIYSSAATNASITSQSLLVGFPHFPSERQCTQEDWILPRFTQPLFMPSPVDSRSEVTQAGGASINNGATRTPPPPPSSSTNSARQHVSPLLRNFNARQRASPLLRTSRQRASPLPTPLPPTPTRRRRGRRLHQDAPSPLRRTRTQTQSDLARQAFARSDSEWRAFQQDAERERIRLREMELGQNERWLDLFGQFLVFGNRIVDVLENK